MEKLEHRHITRYIESFIQDNEMFIAVEWAQNGDLKQFIRGIREEGRPKGWFYSRAQSLAMAVRDADSQRSLAPARQESYA